jgi:hypothetical protein
MTTYVYEHVLLLDNKNTSSIHLDENEHVFSPKEFIKQS